MWQLLVQILPTIKNGVTCTVPLLTTLKMLNGVKREISYRTEHKLINKCGKYIINLFTPFK